MKRFLIALSVLALAGSQADAQGLLGRLKEQAAQAMGSAIGISEETPEQVGDDEAVRSDDPNAVVTGEQALPKRRASTFGWDGPVTPSSAKFPIPLMNEFPAVPSAADLINPVESKQIEYYKALKAVTLRAEELNQDSTCEKEETELWRNKVNDALKSAFGLTDAELAILQDENASEADQQRVSDKIAAAMLGGVDVNAMEADAAKYENMSEDELMAQMSAKTLQAQFSVYDRNAAGINKYMGVTVAEVKDAAREQMSQKNPDKPSPKSVALQKKSEAYQKAQAAGDPAFKKEAAAFQNKLQGELRDANMKASRSMMGSMGAVMEVQENANKKMAPIMEMQNKLRQYEENIIACFPQVKEDADYSFAAGERKKVLAIKEKIYKTTDPSVYNPLYLQALKLIMSYRERAAKVWVADVQKRFNAQKEALPKIIKVNRQAIADGVIPECALYREPLNMVIIAGDILADAYSEFPSDYPPMWKEEIVNEVNLPAGHGIWWPEFSVFGQADFDAIVSGKHIYSMDEDGVVTHYVNGSWIPVTNDEFKKLNGKKKDAGAPVSTTWTSSDGQRKVFYNADGGYLQMPEGDQVFPTAWKKDGNLLKWLITRTSDDDAKYQVILCTYML
ncbi:MAG: hypothetical protein IK008_06650 [Bacteroidales bacterium]|nr:hypothetical protein [Bacteroidales bacterium]